jgi:hypothetical protein
MSKEVYANLMKMYEGQLGNKAIAQEVMKDAVDKSITTQKTFDLIKTLL